MDENHRLLVISGSNMSGKSTLLRTVGINAVLAQAGAPVRAASLRLSPLQVGATLRIQDSLLEGRSRFYAEITRIRELADIAAGSMPLLFLLDELFHGTNSHDRLAGAEGVLRSLLDRGAIGLITTHDLADNGLYGVGESYYALARYDSAATAYREVEERYPRGDRVASALYKLGVVEQKLGHTKEARDAFTRLREKYPRSGEARLAEERLRELQ